MNTKTFSIALGNVRNEYVTEAITYQKPSKDCDENTGKEAEEPMKKTRRSAGHSPIIETGKCSHPSQKPAWVKWGTLAACLCLILIGGLLISDQYYMDAPQESGTLSDMEEETMLATGYLNIFYLTPDGTIESKDVEVRCMIEDIFNEWAILNHVSGVTVISSVYDDGGTDSVQDLSGTSVVVHSSGNYYTLDVTLSAEFSTYTEGEQGELLIKTLRKTLYDYIYFDAFTLMIEGNNEIYK